MLRSISYAHSSQALHSLSTALKKWIAVNEEYAKGHADDASWWYNERATLSTLAGAAWRVQWLALEEFSTNKLNGKIDKRTKKKVRRYGRCDLYLTNQSVSYVVEAKQAWQPIGPRCRNPLREVDRLSRAAFHDVGKLGSGEGDKRLALVFVVPSFPASLLPKQGKQAQAREYSTKLILEWLALIKKKPVVKGRKLNYHAIAASFPLRTRVLLGRNETRVYPGVVALIWYRKKAMKVAAARRQ